MVGESGGYRRGKQQGKGVVEGGEVVVDGEKGEMIWKGLLMGKKEQRWRKRGRGGGSEMSWVL